MFPRDASSTRFAKPRSLSVSFFFSRDHLGASGKFSRAINPAYCATVSNFRYHRSKNNFERLWWYACCTEFRNRRALVGEMIAILRNHRYALFSRRACVHGARRRRMLTMYLTFLAFIIIGADHSVSHPDNSCSACFCENAQRSLQFFLFSFHHTHTHT